MIKPNLYNFFKFIKNKSGKDIKNSGDWLKLKAVYSPSELTEEELKEVKHLQFQFKQNLPNGLTNEVPIRKVELYGSDITEVPTGLELQLLSLSRTANVTTLPPIKVETLNLWYTGVSEISKDLVATNVFISDSPISSLSFLDNLKLRLTVLSGLPIDSLGDIKTRSLYLQGNLPNLTQLPDNFTVGLSLEITGNTAIKSLPKGLKVDWNLSLLCEPQFDILPDDLQVGQRIEVYQMPTYYPKHLEDKIVVKKKA